MKKIPFWMLISVLTLGVFQSGCALFLIGAGAAGGYSISKDEIEGLSDVSFDKVWNAARDVVRTQGAITAENKSVGTMEAVIGGSTAEFKIEQVTPKTVRTRIKARQTKGLFPDIELAQDLYSQMLRKMK